MKTKLTILLLLLVASAFKALYAVDDMTIKVDVTSAIGYEIRPFAVGTQLFTNRTNMPINDVPAIFTGYKLLTSDAAADLTGTITAPQAGEIYLIIKKTGVAAPEGWSIVEGSDFSYSTTNTLMAVFKKTVTANEVVAIPTNSDFRRVTLLAKDITIAGQAGSGVSQMSIKVETFDAFEKNILANATKVFLNRDYTAYDISADINGFDYLTSNVGISNDGIVHRGTIVPSENGDIYIIAQKGKAIEGWVAAGDLGFKYDAVTGNGTSTGLMQVYKKTVAAGERTEIPVVDNFQEARPLAKSIELIRQVKPDEMSITVEVAEADAAMFTQTVFANGNKIFSNRTYTIVDAPNLYNGFDFLASNGSEPERGVIVPSADGTIYLAAKLGGIDGWTVAANSTFYYNTPTPTEMAIYQRSVKAGERIELPLLSDFQGATPLAKSIELKIVAANQEARLSDILVDGVSISGFAKETAKHNYSLPYTYSQRPTVTATAVSATASITIAEVEDARGTEDERTATITVVSEDKSQTKVYKVMFEVVPEMDLYLCIGQSNMAGYAPLDASKGDMATMDNVYLLNAGDRFEQASNPLNKYSNVAAGSAKVELGPSYSFAQTIKSRSEAPIGIIVNARGGSSIENWTKGGTGDVRDTLYIPTMKRATEALKWGTFKGIIWHQGEANKNGDLDVYKTRIQQFVSDLRTDLGDNNLPFVAGQIGRFGLTVDNFNNFIINIADFVPNSACVSSEGLGNIDPNHFDREGALELGRRYARAMINKVYPVSKMQVTIEADAGIFVKRKLETDVALLTDRTYKITNTDFSGFENFDLLASKANAGGVIDEEGVMIPASDGYLYAIADSASSIAGWQALAGTEMKLYVNASSTVVLRVFAKKVKAGERIAIPASSNFRGITPLAQTIVLNEKDPADDARLSGIVVDGLALTDFNRDVKEYTYVLPYTATAAPSVTANVRIAGATIESITPAANINSANEADRTTLIAVKSSNGNVTEVYKVIFKVLPEMDLFLCIGQSNMAGAAKLVDGDKEYLDDAYLFNSNNKFEPARNGMNRYANVLTSATEYYGLTHAFAKKIVEKTGKPIGLIVNARGGSSIVLWDKNGSGAGDTLYVRTMDRALEAKKWGKYSAILWHQGEANRTNWESTGYMNRLKELTANLRTDLANDTLLFVAGEIGHWREDNKPFNTLINTIEDNISHSGIASAEGLINITNLADMDSHFDRQSLITLGERYADIVYERLYKDSGTTEPEPEPEKDAAIIVNGSKFEKRVFGNGAKPFTNREYPVEGLADNFRFNGYEFLASEGSVPEEGSIIAKEDGKIYILARGTVDGWTKVEGSDFVYRSSATATAVMSVFAKSVKAGDETPLPMITNFQGVSPIAPSIDYSEPTPPSEIYNTPILVDDNGKNLYSLRVFKESEALFIGGPSYRMESIPEDFANFKFLASASNVDEEASIIPQEDGKVYVIAKTGGLGPDWTVVPNSSFYSDYTCDQMVVYERFALKDERIAMPQGHDLEGVSPLAKNIEYNAANIKPSEIHITIDGSEGIFESKTFENGSIPFRNRSYFIDNIPAQFGGFEYLASNASDTDEVGAAMIASDEGYMYILAKSGLTLSDGWQIVANSEFSYNDANNTKMAIYQKPVEAGERVLLPSTNGDFRGVSPLAKRIYYGASLAVEGELIDIRSVVDGEAVFPQKTTYKFKASTTPSYLIGQKYAVSLFENEGVKRIKSDAQADVFIASDNANLQAEGWIKTADNLTIGSLNYYIYKNEYKQPDQWLAIPQGRNEMPTIVFASKIVWNNPLDLPEASTMIAQSFDPKNAYIFNPSITVMPDGDYIASCTGAYRLSGTLGISVFLSTDKGQTWTTQTKNSVVTNYGNLFVHNGLLYLMGTSGTRGDVTIRKSADKGKTWSEPTDATTGILLAGEYHTAPVPVVVHKQRIWRAMETNPLATGKKEIFIMSAPVNSDLLKASNWTSTNTLSYSTDWISDNGRSFSQWLEGNAVVDPSGNVVNVLRVDEQKYDGVAAIATASDATTLTFDPAKDIIQFPGGGKKFTIRYDKTSKKYWAISNAVFDEDRGRSHSGIYSSGIHCGLLRNRVVLMNSDDLRSWAVQDTLISYDNPFFYGFQYLDWQFDGDDIVAVSRTAFEDSRGLPARQHDANFMLFHRFENFRKHVTDNKSDDVIINDDIAISLVNREVRIAVKDKTSFVTSIYDMSGQRIHSSKDLARIGVDGWGRGIFVVQVIQDNKKKTTKIAVNY